MKTIDFVLSNWAAAGFKAAFPENDFSGADLSVNRTTNDSFGDFQCNASMGLAKLLKMPPRAIAEKMVEVSATPECVEKVEIAGPGFINIFLKSSELARYLERLENNEKHGVPQVGENKTVVIDYSSPNVAKPMHIGHIRSTVIGNAIDRLHRYTGYKVVADNHLGDWGTQFGLIIMGYKNFLDEKALAESPVEELERLYVKSYNMSKEDDTWRDQARNELVKLQQGDAENRALWQQFIDLTIEEFNKTYDRLGVSFDLYRGESYYNDVLPATVDRLVEEGLAEESDGALIVNQEDENLAVCIVRKRDGGFNYASTDIATVVDRVDEFDPDKIIYVTDERQQLHFKQFFNICKKLGVKNNLVHVWFGLMRLPEATFSTREGNVIKLKDLLDESEKRAFEIVKKSSPNMSEAQQLDVARAVGIGAIKYADLSQNPQSLVTFTWEKALSMEGNSSPYLQYAYARIQSVRDKYATQFPEINLADYPIELTEKVERRLAMQLTQFPAAVIAATENYRPNLLAEYLYNLSQAYSSFYQNVPFLKAEAGPRESRIRLCGLVARTLKQGLELLGIETPERI